MLQMRMYSYEFEILPRMGQNDILRQAHELRRHENSGDHTHV